MARKLLNKSIVKIQKDYPFIIEAWVLLPEHFHCIWTLPDNDNNFSIRWSLIKSQFSKSAKSLFHRPEWMNYSKQKHRETFGKDVFGNIKSVANRIIITTLTIFIIIR